MTATRKQVPIYYRPIERHWYRLVDLVQPRWRRFADSRPGYWTGKTLGVVLVVLFQLAKAVAIVGALVLYTFLMFAMTGGKGKRR